MLTDEQVGIPLAPSLLSVEVILTLLAACPPSLSVVGIVTSSLAPWAAYLPSLLLVAGIVTSSLAPLGSLPPIIVSGRNSNLLIGFCSALTF